jgi:hypothetical protein
LYNQPNLAAKTKSDQNVVVVVVVVVVGMELLIKVVTILTNR